MFIFSAGCAISEACIHWIWEVTWAVAVAFGGCSSTEPSNPRNHVVTGLSSRVLHYRKDTSLPFKSSSFDSSTNPASTSCLVHYPCPLFISCSVFTVLQTSDTNWGKNRTAIIQVLIRISTKLTQ